MSPVVASVAMRHRDLLCQLALLTLPVTLAAQPIAARTATPAPIPVEPQERDLGILAVGDPISAEFSVLNRGQAELDLRSVQVPRGVRVEGVPGKVAPGASHVVRLTVTSGAGLGPLEVEALVSTSDAVQPTIRLLLKATVQAFLVMNPGYARFIVVQQAKDGTISQTVGAADGAKFNVLKVESPHPSLRATFSEARPEQRRADWQGSQWRVDATLIKDAAVGPLTGDLVVHTDHPRQRVVRAPVSGFVRPIFAVTPPNLKLGDIEPASEPISLSVKNYAEELIDLLGAESDVRGVRAELKALQPGRSWALLLSFDPTRPVGVFEGRVRIRTGSPKVPSIDVPLKGRTVRPKAEAKATPSEAAAR